MTNQPLVYFACPVEEPPMAQKVRIYFTQAGYEITDTLPENWQGRNFTCVFLASQSKKLPANHAQNIRKLAGQPNVELLWAQHRGGRDQLTSIQTLRGFKGGQQNRRRARTPVHCR